MTDYKSLHEYLYGIYPELEIWMLEEYLSLGTYTDAAKTFASMQKIEYSFMRQLLINRDPKAIKAFSDFAEDLLVITSGTSAEEPNMTPNILEHFFRTVVTVDKSVKNYVKSYIFDDFRTFCRELEIPYEDDLEAIESSFRSTFESMCADGHFQDIHTELIGIEVLIVGESSNTTKTTPIQGKNMKTTIAALATNNKTNAVAVARVTAGKALNKKLVKLIKPKLPLPVRGFADSGFAPVILANAVAFAIKQYADNSKANMVADLMLEASAFQLADSFNIDDMLEDLLDGITLPGAGNVDIMGMTMPELRAFAEDNGIDLTGISTKTAIRETIEAAL